jgi:ubiquinone/menaquinone biosynthesis C-methylase UbiE
MKFDKIKIGGGDTGEPINVSRRINLITSYANLKNKFILDCGCGSGNYLLFFMNYSENVFGIEYSGEKVEKYKSGGISGDNIVQGNIEDMPFENQKFDLVFLNEVLEHISNQEKALKEIYRVLKKDGIMVVITPNRFYPFETHGIIYKSKNWLFPLYIPLIPYIPVKVGKIFFEYPARNYFSWELRKLIKENGFNITKHTFISQTFEGIGGINNEFYMLLRPILRKIFFIMEKIPLLKKFICVSQVIIAKKLLPRSFAISI